MARGFFLESLVFVYFEMLFQDIKQAKPERAVNVKQCIISDDACVVVIPSFELRTTVNAHT